MVRFLHMAPAVVRGMLGPVKLASPITASLEEVGTPFVQFAANVQIWLDPPIQLVDCAETDMVIIQMERKRKICFIGKNLFDLFIILPALTHKVLFWYSLLQIYHL